MLNYELDIDAARSGAHAAFRLLDDHLITQQVRGSKWLVGTSPTIADIACLPYVALAPMGDVSLEPFPAVRGWIEGFKKLPGYKSMPGLEAPDYRKA